MRAAGRVHVDGEAGNPWERWEKLEKVREGWAQRPGQTLSGGCPVGRAAWERAGSGRVCELRDRHGTASFRVVMTRDDHGCPLSWQA